MKNIHGHCPHCHTSLDGDLIINYPLNQGKTMEEAREYAENYGGWEEHGLENRWGRAIGIYDLYKDRTTHYKCPDCEKTWER